ncbi:hypothetical protein MsAg5_17360 [Methanosarcinaceae archaeon Ag5]|uniref:Uncharacterized protein n=1 Tax=Methanolapillus africanus TaxID=3028297 RepID=A0AAE4SEI9_9EURY|nr:hypothetical protein [Methanosarcinaceae archaeon Ag5]
MRSRFFEGRHFWAVLLDIVFTKSSLKSKIMSNISLIFTSLSFHFLFCVFCFSFCFVFLFSIFVSYSVFHICFVFCFPYLFRILFSIFVSYSVFHICFVFCFPYLFRILFSVFVSCMISCNFIYSDQVTSIPYFRFAKIWNGRTVSRNLKYNLKSENSQL